MNFEDATLVIHMYFNRLNIRGGDKIVNFILRILHIIKSCSYDDSIFRLPSADFILFCHDVDRSLVRDDRIFSPIMDFFSQDIKMNGFSVIQISLPFSTVRKDHTWGNSFKLNRFFLAAKLIDKAIQHFSKSKKNYFEILLYKHIYNTVNPKCVVAIGSSHAMCVSAKICNVKTVELIHGMGITPIPWGWNTRRTEELPHYVVCFDAVSKKTFELLNGILVLLMTHPFVSYFFRFGVSCACPQDWHPRKSSGKFDKEILVTLSWGYAQDNAEFDGILSNGLYFSELLEVISATKNSILWHFRIHPVHLRSEKYSWVIEHVENIASLYSNIEWKDSSVLPLLSVLSSCTGHISMLSTSTYEAALIGVPSLLLCPTLKSGGKYSDMFDDLVQLGYANKSTPSFNNILQWVESVSLKSPLVDNQSEYLSVEHVIQRIVHPEHY